LQKIYIHFFFLIKLKNEKKTRPKPPPKSNWKAWQG
jgi:hypothetical protein